MQRTEVSFLSGEILRKEMLQDMYEYPRVIMEGYYSGYSDGILYGLNWKDAEKSGHHIITPGALKLHGKIYFLANPLDVEECFDSLSSDTRYRLFFLESDQVQCQPSRKIYNLDLRALKSGDVEKVRDEGFYYAYVNFTVEGGFRFIRDDEQLYGLYAAVNGGRNAYSLPPYWLEKDILPILTDKQKRHPFDYELIGSACTALE